MVEAGYEAIELGPYGYLPKDPAELQDALERTDLTVLAGTVFSHLHQPDAWDYTWKQVTDVAALTKAVGGDAHRGHSRRLARPEDRRAEWRARPSPTSSGIC